MKHTIWHILLCSSASCTVRIDVRVDWRADICVALDGTGPLVDRIFPSTRRVYLQPFWLRVATLLTLCSKGFVSLQSNIPPRGHKTYLGLKYNKMKYYFCKYNLRTIRKKPEVCICLFLSSVKNLCLRIKPKIPRTCNETSEGESLEKRHRLLTHVLSIYQVKLIRVNTGVGDTANGFIT